MICDALLRVGRNRGEFGSFLLILNHAAAAQRPDAAKAIFEVRGMAASLGRPLEVAPGAKAASQSANPAATTFYRKKEGIGSIVSGDRAR